MKKWIRRALIVAVPIGLTVGALYETATHVGRGWLRGEAFYEGRPTSYWALRCDEWLERFEDADSLTLLTCLLPYEIPGHDGFRMWVPDDVALRGGGITMPPGTTWKRFRDSLRSKDDLERDGKFNYAPRILWGSPDTEPVLLALEREYR